MARRGAVAHEAKAERAEKAGVRLLHENEHASTATTRTASSICSSR